MIGASGIAGWLGVRKRDQREASVVTLTDEKADLSAKLAEVLGLVGSGYNACEKALESLVEALNGAAGLTADARVSLYEATADGWARRARYSHNLLYMSSGRSVLPFSQGVIHRAYLVGEFSIDGLPDFDEDQDRHFAEQKKMHITKSVCRDFSMHSRSYSAFSFGASRESENAGLRLDL